MSTPYQLMTCLYECIYRCMQYLGRSDALPIITSPLGFSIEAHIPSRSWLLCGQSDIDYYQPILNRGIRAQWISVTLPELIKLFAKDGLPEKPVIVETDARQIRYYRPGALSTGMPHAFILFHYDAKRGAFQVFDRLAPETAFERTAGLFWVSVERLEAAFAQKLFYLHYEDKGTSLSWPQEFLQCLKQSMRNMLRQVGRLQANFQVFGLEGLKVFRETLLSFPQSYQEDAQSIWIMSQYFPVNILQSVYGNRFFFKKALQGLTEFDSQGRLQSRLESDLNAWRDLRKQCMACANGLVDYPMLAEAVQRIIDCETRLASDLEETLHAWESRSSVQSRA